MKQGFEFLDTESGYKFKLTGASDVLPKDITVVVPDDVDGAVLATSKEVEDLRTKLVNGTITVRDTATLGGKLPSEYVLKSEVGNLGSSGETFKQGIFNLTSSVAAPAANNFLAVFTTKNSQNTIPNDQIIDNSTLLLKAGCAYKIEGGCEQVTATSGILTDQLVFLSKTTGLNVAPTILYGSYGYIASGVSYRNYNINCYFVPTEDTYLKVKVTNNTLVSNTSYETKFIITEYSTKEISLANMKINGKTFDNNNNIDLEGLSTLSNYSTTEVLTEKRWINGKPIYRKVLDNFVWAGNDIIVPFDVGQETIVYKTYLIDDVEESANSHYINDGSEARLTYTSSTKTFCINYYDSATWANGYKFTIVVEYTKVADTALSPVRLVGSGNGTAGIVSELPALTGSEGKLLRVNQNGLLEWKKSYFCSKTNAAAVSYAYNKTTNMVINSVVSGDNECSASGVNGGFNAPETGVYSISGDYLNGSPSHVNVTEIYLTVYVNSIIKKQFKKTQISGSTDKSFDFACDLKLEQGDLVTFQIYIWSNSSTVNNNLIVPANSMTFTMASK